MESARDEGRAIVIESKEEAIRLRSEWEDELRERRAEITKTERRLGRREENLEKRAGNLDRRESKITKSERRAQNIEDGLEDLRQQTIAKLEEISELSLSEARGIVMREAEEEMRHEIARRYRDIEERYREDSREVASKILASAIQRMASETVSELTVTTVPLPNDDMKGRLIGREGRNIRAIEKSTGVDLIIDDTPEAVTPFLLRPDKAGDRPNRRGETRLGRQDTPRAHRGHGEPRGEGSGGIHPGGGRGSGVLRRGPRAEPGRLSGCSAG